MSFSPVKRASVAWKAASITEYTVDRVSRARRRVSDAVRAGTSRRIMPPRKLCGAFRGRLVGSAVGAGRSARRCNQ